MHTCGVRVVVVGAWATLDLTRGPARATRSCQIPWEHTPLPEFLAPSSPVDTKPGEPLPCHLPVLCG